MGCCAALRLFYVPLLGCVSHRIRFSIELAMKMKGVVCNNAVL